MKPRASVQNKLDHHALGLAGRTRRVDHVGQIRSLRPDVEVVGGLSGKHRHFVFEHDARRAADHVGELALRDDDLEARIADHVGEAITRVHRVQGHIGGTGLVHGVERDDHLERAADHDADQVATLYTLLLQMPREAVGRRIELGIAHAAAFEVHGFAIGRTRNLRLELLVHAGRRQRLALRFRVRRVPRIELDAVDLRQHGQAPNRPRPVRTDRFREHADRIYEAVEALAIETRLVGEQTDRFAALTYDECQRRIATMSARRQFVGLGRAHEADRERGAVTRRCATSSRNSAKAVPPAIRSGSGTMLVK